MLNNLKNVLISGKYRVIKTMTLLDIQDRLIDLYFQMKKNSYNLFLQYSNFSGNWICLLRIYYEKLILREIFL